MPNSTKSEPPRETVTISIGMQKGGVAKTTNALHLSAALAEAGRRVLLWDVDENYGATKVFGLGDSALTTSEILAGDCEICAAILSSEGTGREVEFLAGLDFIPSSRALQGLERRPADRAPIPSDCLRPHVEEVKALGRYDFVLIDTGPHASLTTRGAYLVSDYFILSLTPDKQAIASLPDALRDIAHARKQHRNPDLHLLGLIMAGVDRRLVLARHYDEAIAQGFLDRDGRPVKFETTISTAAAIDRAYQQNLVLLQAEPNHRVSHQYRALAREVEVRIKRHRQEKNARALPSELEMRVGGHG